MSTHPLQPAKAASAVAKVEILSIPASWSPSTGLLPPALVLDCGSLRGCFFRADERPHGNADLAIAHVGVARVANHHVVHADHVALLPLEAHGALLVNLSHMLHHRVRNFRPIAVINMARQ